MIDTKDLYLVYQDWNHSYHRLHSEEVTLWRYKEEYKNRISKRIPKEMVNYTCEQWCEFAYNINMRFVRDCWEKRIDGATYNNMLDTVAFPFQITAKLKSNDQVYANLAFRGDGMCLRFINECNLIYMCYNFNVLLDSNGEYIKKKEGYLFLNCIKLIYYSANSKENDKIPVTDLLFDPDGRLRKHEFYYNEMGKPFERLSETDELLNITFNWQKYPIFGDWLPLFEMKRWKDGELTLPFIDNSK